MCSDVAWCCVALSPFLFVRHTKIERETWKHFFGMFSAFNTGRNMAFFDIARNSRTHIRTSWRCYCGLATIWRIIVTLCRPWPMEAVHAQNVPELGKTHKLVPIAEVVSVVMWCRFSSPSLQTLQGEHDAARAGTQAEPYRRRRSMRLGRSSQGTSCRMQSFLRRLLCVSAQPRFKFGARRKRGSRITNTMVVAAVSRRSSAPPCRDCTPQVCQCESWCDRSTR